MTTNKYNYYFYILLVFLVFILGLDTYYSLSISYKEALNVYVNHSVLSTVANSFIYIFGQNDLALRAPFILFYTLSAILMYQITDSYSKYETDRLLSIIIFMLLPGVLGASLLVNSSIIVIFCTLLYLYYYKKYDKHSYILLLLLLLIDNSFAILYLAIFFHSFKINDSKIRYFSLGLFIISLMIFGFTADGKPKGYLVDTFGIYATIFSPALFLYFLYSIYRAGIKKEYSLNWYISVVALILSFAFSFRQKVFIEDFAPYVVISLPLTIKTFLHSYRIRLKEYRKFYSFIGIVTVSLLCINVVFTFFNKPLYMYLSNPAKHFAYEYHFTKELARKLKKTGINEIDSNDKELILKLKFYNIDQGSKYFLSTKPISDFDNIIDINSYGKSIYKIYVKKQE